MDKDEKKELIWSALLYTLLIIENIALWYLISKIADFFKTGGM